MRPYQTLKKGPLMIKRTQNSHSVLPEPIAPSNQWAIHIAYLVKLTGSLGEEISG